MQESVALHVRAPLYIDPSVRAGYAEFIKRCGTSDGRYRLTPNAEPTTYALCFAIFGLQLLGDHGTLATQRDTWNSALREGLADVRRDRERKHLLRRDKPYLQLLTFTLSALAILGTLDRDPLAEEVLPIIPRDVTTELADSGSLAGLARTGNHAMFLAILLIHAGDRLGFDASEPLGDWVRAHLAHMNQFGFWGNAASMSHLQFQNGYHQYEIFEYLDVPVSGWSEAAKHVAALADDAGHFAPYPGGGSCYDYDAAFMLTGGGEDCLARHRSLLLRTAHAILSEQNPDGGFAESLRIRPRSPANLARMARHVLSGRGRARWERFRLTAAMLRPKHDRVHIHWAKYLRRWDESSLWDSWFRMLTLARIQVALDPSTAEDWGFIDFPGIGFHRELR